MQRKGEHYVNTTLWFTSQYIQFLIGKLLVEVCTGEHIEGNTDICHRFRAICA